MKEMFIQSGFDDFIAKPIDVSKLDESLNRWIPKEKRALKELRPQTLQILQPQPLQSHGQNDNSIVEPSELGELSAIPGIDTAKGIAMTGGTLASYKQVLSLYCKDADERLPHLEKMQKENMNMFVTNVHALKSASASIGAADISAQAAELEAAGKAGNKAFILTNLPAFIWQISELSKKISAALGTNEEAPVADQKMEIPEGLAGLLRDLKSALQDKKTAEIDTVLDELNQKQPDAQIRELLEKISDDVLMTEFDSAVKKIDEVLGT